MAETIAIKRVQELLDYLDHKGAEGSALWFRGQRNAEWSLLPGYMRLVSPPSESTLLSRFKQNAARLLDFPPATSFDWMFLMQHYGVPTRLLDWSENPLAALYFATLDTREQTSGALWVLEPVRLNEYSGIKNPDEPSYIPSFDDSEEVEGYAIESIRNSRNFQLKPIATIATRNSARIQAQAGVFTIHHLSNQPIEKIDNGSHVTKIVVENSDKSSIRSQLKTLGFTRFHLFPELESVGMSVKDGLS